MSKALLFSCCAMMSSTLTNQTITQAYVEQGDEAEIDVKDDDAAAVTRCWVRKLLFGRLLAKADSPRKFPGMLTTKKYLV